MKTTSVAVGLLTLFSSAFVHADVTIQGHVVSADGQPVPDALVFWSRPVATAAADSIDGRTDENGNFHLTLETSKTDRDLRTESVFVYAEGHGLTQLSVAFLSKATQSNHPATVTLAREAQTSFRVFDAQHRVLAGQLVEPLLYTSGSGTELPAGLVQAAGRLSDEEGIIRMPAFPSERLQAVRVMPDTYGCQNVHVSTGEGSAIRGIALRDAGRVDIVFNGESFLRVPNWKVEVLSVDRLTRSAVYGSYTHRLESKKPFTIPALAEGELHFQLSGCRNDEPELPHWPDDKPQLNVGSKLQITIPIKKTVTVRGRIVERGMPAANVAIRVFSQPAGCWIAAQTDQAGKYAANVLPGPVSVHVTVRRQIGIVGTTSKSMTVHQIAGPQGGELPDVVLD